MAVVRTDGGAHVLGFPSPGTETLTASDAVQIESNCAAASSIAVGDPLVLAMAAETEVTVLARDDFSQPVWGESFLMETLTLALSVAFVPR